MKRGWKIFWIVCAVLAGLGLVLCLAGVVTGATLEGVRSVLSSGETVDDDEWHDEADDDTDQKKAPDSVGTEDAAEVTQSTDVKEFTGVRELEIEVSYLEVEIEEYEGDTIRVDTSGIDQDLCSELVVDAGEELKIEVKNKSKWEKFFKNHTGTLRIQIPEDYFLGEVSIEVGAGELRVEDITAGELSIKVGAGSAVVDWFTADKIGVDCGAGEAEITGDAGRKIQIECGVGSAIYHASGRQEDYNYTLECGIGEVTVGRDSYSGLARKTQIDNNGNVIMEIECGIGEVNVIFEQ